MKNKRKIKEKSKEKKPVNFKMWGAVILLVILVFIRLSPTALNATLSAVTNKDCNYHLLISDIKKLISCHTLSFKVFKLPKADIITSEFGEREDPVTGEKATHLGIDINAPLNSDVRASSDGVVLRVEENEYYGKFIIIDHKNGFHTLYGHLNEFIVKAGDNVRQDDVIALSGNSGKSTGPHIHFEIRKDAKPVNPKEYLI